MRKRLTAALLCFCLLFTLLPATAFAEGEPDSGTPPAGSALREHHTQHDESCGYTEGTAEIPCSHEHTEDCYTLVTKCVHTHTADCYPADDTATPSDAEGKEPVCGHVCSEESGCITKTLDCKHEHDEACGYVPATEGTPCTFVCEVCNPQDSGNPATPSDAQPEECTCETLCTEEEVNADCPVCSAEGAELDKVCVGVAPMLPVTALAADNDKPNNLYVGNQNVKSGDDTTYWATTDSGELELVEGASDTSNNWNVKYDPNSATLTLKNATIEGEYDDVNISGAGIYAASSSGPVSLNIVLEEENKVSGWNGINVSSGGDASLNISGSGSLTVSGLSGNGIGIFMSSQNSANLTIEEASVTALGSQNGGSGVRLITSQTGSPSLTIEVKGGSLQASGETNGIHFLSNVNGATAVANLKVSGNAMVKASNIITTKDGTGSAPELKPAASGSDGTGGIIWDGKNGTVYGDVTLDENLTIGEGESLDIPSEASLTIPEGTTLTVNGGELKGNVPQSGVVYKVTEVKLDKTSLTLDVNESETLTATITPDNATNPNVTWSSDNQNVATVDRNGEVTAIGVGNTTIKATVDGKTAECSVTVNAAQTYTVTLVTNGGTINSGDVTEYTYGVGATLPTAEDMTYNGYVFKGWYEQSDFCGSPVTEITATDTGDKTYYAKWLSTDAGVASVFVNGVAGNISGNQITVTLPPNSALPDGTDDIAITPVAGAAPSNLTISTGTESVIYTFTVTAEDGQTTAGYTVIVTVADDPAAGNKADVDAAKTAIERHTWTVPQATANTEEAVKAWIEGQLAGMNLNGASYTLTMTGFTAAVEGTSADRDGTDGSFAFTVVLSKGTDTGDASTGTYAEAAATVTGGTITATVYRSSGDPYSGGSYTGPVGVYYADGRTEGIPSDVTPGDWEMSEGADGSISWRFKLTDGSYATNRWIKALWNDQYLWYHLDADGYLQSGWYTDTDGNMYYLHPLHDGAFGYMYTGERVIDGVTYNFSKGEEDGFSEGALKR